MASVFPSPLCDLAAHHNVVFVRDLRLTMLIGILPHEKTQPQEVVINIEFYVREHVLPISGDIGDFLDYSVAVSGIREMAAARHRGLLEEFIHEIADYCLRFDPVESVCVQIEKTQVLPDAISAGIRIVKAAH